MSNVNFDNKTLKILDHGDEELRASLAFAFSMFNIKTIKSYRIMRVLKGGINVDELEFSTWDGDHAFTKFPFPVGTVFATEFASNWLDQATYTEGNHDYDVSEYRGFEISCHSDTIKIKPAWAQYGK